MFFRSGHPHATITGGVDGHVRPGFGQVEPRFHGHGLSVLVLPMQTFDVPVKAPHVVRVLRSAAQRSVQAKIIAEKISPWMNQVLFPIGLLPPLAWMLFSKNLRKGADGATHNRLY